MLYLIGPIPPRARQFYLLPKIHKTPDTWMVPHEVPPGRPIVSDCGSESFNSAHYIDHFLNPLSQLHESYLKDTYDFIDKIKHHQFPKESFLFSIDIDSLYTNTDTHQGLHAVRQIFKQHSDRNRPDEEVLQLLHINLTRNDFQFNSQFFYRYMKQQWGRNLLRLMQIFIWHIGNKHCSKSLPITLTYITVIWMTYLGFDRMARTNSKNFFF